MVWHARGVLVAALTLTVSGLAHAQNRSQGAPAPSAPSPRASAPIDLTGYWVAIVTQDWRQRMVTPPRGDYASVPLNVAAKKVADMWDPDQPVPADELCRAYGAPAIMRQPTRVHITWQDETTLKVETDAGTQTRLFYFGGRKGPKTAPSWQGDSTAEWDTPPAGRGGSPAKTGSLKVTTTNLRPGFLRKNGIPFSAGTSMTEHWDVFKERNGDQVMLITTTVTDPMYLREPWITALHFKKEADGSKWDPTPCSAK